MKRPLLALAALVALATPAFAQGDFEKKGSYKFRNAEGWQAHSVACIGFQLYNAQCTCMQTPWFPGAGRWGGRSFRLQAMPGLGFIHI